MSSVGSVRAFSHSVWASEESEPVVSSDPAVNELAEQIAGLSLLQVKDLCDVLQDRLGIADVPMGGAMMPMGGGAAAPAEAEEAKEEQTLFDVKLDSFDAKSKIKVIREIKAITGLPLGEAKAFVEGAPSVVKEGISKEAAEELKAKLEGVGAVI